MFIKWFANEKIKIHKGKLLSEFLHFFLFVHENTQQESAIFQLQNIK